jgi:hypothetical protein
MIEVRQVYANTDSETVFRHGRPNFVSNNNNNLLIRISLIDEKGEPNLVSLEYYFESTEIAQYFCPLDS